MNRGVVGDRYTEWLRIRQHREIGVELLPGAVVTLFIRVAFLIHLFIYSFFKINKQKWIEGSLVIASELLKDRNREQCLLGSLDLFVIFINSVYFV